MNTFDYESQFERMKKDTVEALTKVLSIETPSTGRAIKVNRVWVDDTLDSADFESQREAVRKDQTWGVPVYADLELLDKKTGKVLSVTKRTRVATLPKSTNLGSYIVGGQHYQMYNQLRRKPGVYITRKASKDLKAEIHVSGRPMNIEYDPKSGVFFLQSKQSSQPLYPLLSRLGVSDSELAKSWGPKVLEANKLHAPKRHDIITRRVAKMITGEAYDSADVAASAVADRLHNMELAPDIALRTLGKAYERMSPEVIVRSSEELLKTGRGERLTDDRESIEFKKIMSVSDFLRERFWKDDGSLNKPALAIRTTLTNRLANRRMPPSQISRVVPSGSLGSIFETLFTKNDLSRLTDQSNPLGIINGVSKVTITGEGGVRSEQAIKSDDRALHPSYMGFIDPIHTPDSSSIGVVNTLPMGVVKSGNDLKTRVWIPKTKTYKLVTPAEAMSGTLAFPDQYKDGRPIAKMVKAMVGGDTVFVDADKVDAVMPSPQQAFSISSNSIPFLPSIHGVRAQMSTKMLEQAIPLAKVKDGDSVIGREKPLVQVAIGKKTIEHILGAEYSFRAPEDGVIEKVTANKISIRTKTGVVDTPIYNNMPLNGKAFLDSSPTVKVGAVVKKGQLIADSNFTDNGELALGTNLLAAYVPFKGLNFEDGVVITERAAKKLTSEHLYNFSDQISDNATFSLRKYIAVKSNDLTTEIQNKLDDEGVIRKGQTVQKGDPLWVGVRHSMTDADSIIQAKFTKRKPVTPFKETWEGDGPGEVVDVVRIGSKVKVFIRAQEPAQIGDKITNRHGGKGVITKIIPDGQAPHKEDGTPVDIILNPHGITTRMNPSQILETAAAKVAEKTGKAYVVENFVDIDYTKKVADDLKRHGLKDTEMLIDPATNKPIGEVLVGPQYILKLSKQATTQFSSRGVEGGYDVNDNPLRGGEDGAKAIDPLTVYSLLAHGARANLREMATYKATKNDHFWRSIQAGPALGLVTPLPEPTLAYKKFEAYLKGAGVDIKRNGSRLTIMPMTDAQVDRMTDKSSSVKEPLFLRAKDLHYEKGGFLDPIIFGADSKRWGRIDLAEPMPNPVFEDPIKQLTGLKNSQFNALIGGELFVDKKTHQLSSDPGGITGGEAIKHLLSQVDVDKQIVQWNDSAKTASSPQKLDSANKKLKYLYALKKLKLTPEQAYIQTKLPVLPPEFRKISEMPDGSLSAPGLNFLYRDVGLVNKELEWQHSVPFIPTSLRASLRKDLYGGMKALYGLDEPIAKYPAQRMPKGFIDQIAGTGKQAKEGFFQREVLRRNQNLVGRGTIIPEPKLGIDEVGIPEEMAWNIFKPFAIRAMVGLGKRPDEALKSYEARTPDARSALDVAMRSRPVLLNRAPSLHKFSIMALRPKITDGHVVKIPPLVVKGFNADFDGDAMTVHVPILPEAVREAEKMLPSKNLYNPGTGNVVMAPQNEAALGLYQLSRSEDGRKRILAILPESLRTKYATTTLDKKGLTNLLDDVADSMPGDYGVVIGNLKELGDEHTYTTGFTVGLKDLQPHVPERAKIFADLYSKLSKEPKNKQKAIELIQQADKELSGAMAKRLGEQNNNFYQMVVSGARGNMTQLKQIISAPMLVSGHKDEPISVPVTRSFAEGLSFSDYWSTLYGARSVAADKQLQTSKPGAFTKETLSATGDAVISIPDCKTTRGIKLSVANNGRDIEDRFLSKDLRIGGVAIAKAGDPVTSGLMNMLRERNVTEVEVRSPLTCRVGKGTCSKCYGLHEDGNLPAIGENIGVIAGQSISEPLTQMTMRTIHSGGAVGTRGVITGFEKIESLFKLPQMKYGKATLSTVDGKVEKIEPTPGETGFNVYVDKKKHFVPKDLFRPEKIKVGAAVDKGSALSDGMVHPKELLPLKGMFATQEYMADEIQKSYKESAGVNLKRRSIETVLRSMGNTTKVIDPGSSEFIPGDYVPFVVVEEFNQTSLGKKYLSEVVGHVLREDVGSVKAGTVIDDRIKTVLERMGKEQVEVGPRQIEHDPQLVGIHRVAMTKEDWMSQLGYRELKKAIVIGSAQARSSDLHGYAPIPAFAYGAEFNNAPGGKSKREGVY